MERDHSYWQAVDMAKHAKIDDLTDEQIERYQQSRNFTPTGKKGEEIPSSCGKTDRELFEEVLNSEQVDLLIKSYSHILQREKNSSTSDFTQPIKQRQQVTA